MENDFKKNNKQFIRICLLVLACCILGIVKYKISTPAKVTEEQLYNSFYETAKQISNDDVQRKAIADCLLNKIKFKYQGNLQNLNLDGNKKLMDSIGGECAGTVRKISWTPQIEQKMLAKFSAMKELNGVTTEKKNSYAQCVLSKLKIKYPKGLNGSIPQKDMDEIYLSCIQELK